MLSLNKDANYEMRFLIESNGLKYGDVARKIGIHPNSFSMWFRGDDMRKVRKLRIERAVKQLLEERENE